MAGDRRRQPVIAAVQAERRRSGSAAHLDAQAAMRISVSGWSTTEADVDASVAAILSIARQAGPGWAGGGAG